MLELSTELALATLAMDGRGELAVGCGRIKDGERAPKLEVGGLEIVCSDCVRVGKARRELVKIADSEMTAKDVGVIRISSEVVSEVAKVADITTDNGKLATDEDRSVEVDA